MRCKMNKDNLLLCLKSAMVANQILVRDLALSINECLPYAEQIGMKYQSLIQAYEFIISNKDKIPKDEQGRRFLNGDDEIRSSISKTLFGIPLANLKRMEERTFNSDPIKSAAEPPSHISVASTEECRKASHNGKNNGIIQLCQIDANDTPDPNALEGFIGNREAVNNISTQLQGALARGDALCSTFIRGVSGVGKTELVMRMAKYLGKSYCRVVGSVLKSGDDCHELLSSLPNGAVVHIDECHTLAAEPTAVLLDVLNGTSKYKAKDFWVVFSTNLSASLPVALKNRCLQIKLHDYSLDELTQIIENIAANESVSLDSEAGGYIAKRCHGIARYAVIYTKSIIRANPTSNHIAFEMVQNYFKENGIDDFGLNEEHRQYIKALDKLGVGSIHSLAAAIGENSNTEIENVIEPLLLKHGLVTITSRGRILTEKGLEYVNHIK